MKSHIKKETSEAFDQVVWDFMKSHDSNLLPRILETGMEIVSKVRRYYIDLYFSDFFDKDMVIEYLYNNLGDWDKNTPTRNLRNIAYTRVKQMIETSNVPHLETYDAHVYSVNVTSRIVFQESLNEILSDLPLRIKAAVLYLIYFPEKTSSLKTTPLSTIDFFLTLQCIEKLQKMVESITSEGHTFQFKLPETQISRLLLISSLYKISPATLVLLMQGRNLNSLIQFCTLFGGQTVAVPTVAEFQQTIQQASDLAVRLEENSLSIGDQEALAYLASDLDKVEEYDQNIPLNPVLSAFFESILKITLKNYDNYQKRLIENVDSSNPEEVMNIYEIMNRELRTQIQLVMEITSSVEGKDEIERIIKLLTKTYNGR